MKKRLLLLVIPMLFLAILMQTVTTPVYCQSNCGDAYWNMTNATVTSNTVPNTTFSDIGRGNNNGTTTLITTTSASSGYPGASGGGNAGAAARIGPLDINVNGSAYFEIVITPNPGTIFTFTGISFGSRSTSTGPQAYTIRTSLDNYATEIAGGTFLNNSVWALKSNTGLSVASGSGLAFTVRIYGYNGTGSPTSGTANWRIDDLTITGCSNSSDCPIFTSAPANVTITNSTCQSDCTIGGGTITAPTGTPCPTGSTLYYSLNGGAWSTTIPVYDQDGPSQSITTRCQCDTDPTVFSPTSDAVTTTPGTCTIPVSPTISIVNNVCPSTTGTISASGCETGTVLEWSTNNIDWSTTTPTYTTSQLTVYARCKNITTNCISPVVSSQTNPVPCSGSPTIKNAGGPTIADPCTCAGNGRFNEEVVVTSITGETWTVLTNTGFLNPVTFIPFSITTPLVETAPGSGIFTLVGVHLDDVGYSLSVTNGTTTLSISNECWYPDPTISGLNDNYCENSPAITLSGSAQLGDGSGPATAESQSFTIDGTTATIFDPVVLGAGVYEVIYIFDAADDNPTDKHPGCIAYDTLNVTVNALPDLTVGSNSPVCVGQTLNLTASGVGVTQWSWSGPNSFTSTVQNPSINNITTAATGKYFVTGTNTTTGCSTLDSTIVIINQLPIVDAGSNSPLCEGENLNLTASGIGVDQWSWTGPNNFISTVQNPTISLVTLAHAGKYFVSGTVSSTGCSGIDSVEVVIYDNPEPPIVQNINVCQGGSTQIKPESTIGGGGGTCNATVDMVITGVVDGPLTGGIPKAVEFYVINDIPNLSLYGFGSANNGGGTNGQEFTFPAVSVTAGTYIWVATDSTAFFAYFGFYPTYKNGTAPNINGDDAIELFFNGTVIDVFGQINVDGTGQPWEYTDGWVYRIDNTGQDGNTFVLTNWIYSGIDALDGTLTNASANNPFPIRTFICDLAIDPVMFNFYSDQALTNLLAGPVLSYDPGTTPVNSPQSIWVTQIDPSTGCESEGVEVVITVYAMPTAEAGNNQFYCGLPASITISATSNYNGQWTQTGGAGTIASPTSKTTTYTTNASDIGKTVVFTWTTITPQGACANATDQVGLTTVRPTADAQFAYALDEYCPGSANPTVTHTTGVDGIYTYTVVNAGPTLTLNKLTGEINMATSNWGTYAVTNHVDGRGNLIITGVLDGPLSGGLPKAIELYAIKDIYDLGRYGIESANNGGGSAGVPEFVFPQGQFVAAGTRFWVSADSPQFISFFGFPPTFINNVAQINGDDAIVLYNDGQVIDVFGQVSYPANAPLAWIYEDGWAYRKNNTTNDGTVFNLSNWNFSGRDALDNALTNASANNPWPINSFVTNLSGGCNNNSHQETVVIGDLIPPTLVCPANIGIVLDPGDCSAYVHWDDPVASDNCVTNFVIEQIGGPVEGSEFTMNGSPYTIEYQTTANNQTVTCEFTVTIYGYPEPIIGQLACNDTVQVSLDSICEIKLNADMFLEGGPYQCYNLFQLYINSPSFTGVNITNLPITLTPGNYTITVGDAANTLNTCNTVMVLKDKYPPEIICNCPVGGGGQNGGYTENCILDGCYDPNYNYNLPEPAVIEYCDYDLKLISTEIIYGPTCGTQLLRKTWRATDIGGNSSECTQEYYFKGFDVANMTWPKNYDDLAVNNKMLECDATYPVDELGNPHPSFTGYPTGSGTCKLVEVFYDDVMYPLTCGTKILRNWIVVDDCKGTVYTHTQIIRITDRKAPTFCQPEIFKVNTKAYSCDANVIVPAINCLEDNCCNDLKWWVGTSQNFQISGDLNGNGYVDSNEQWKLMNVPVGVYELRYYAKDCCDNVEVKGVLFEVYDGIPPIANCEQFKTVSLSVYGEAKISAVDFNSGSFDNCKPVYFKTLRVNNNFEYDGGCINLNGDDNEKTATIDVWYDDEVYFCCNDLTNKVMVGMRVFEVDPGSGPVDPRRYAYGGDLYGHYNDCWSIVTVECKVPPALTCPPIEVSCEESLDPNINPKLWPQVTYICNVDLTYTDVRDNNVCSGNVTRTWTAKSCDKTSQCKQSIKINPSTPFDPCTIVFPADKQVHCTNQLPEGGAPTWDEYPCNVVTAEVIKEDTFNFVEGACKKILREWAVIDWCVYKPNVGAEANIDAVTSARKLNCNSLVRDGYYRYTQELRVVDFIPPTIHTEDQCIGFTDGCYATGVKLQAFASDSCNTNEEYWWKYVVIDMDSWDTIQYSYNYLPKPLTGIKGLRSRDKLDKTATSTLELLNPIPGGIYKVVWTVGDGCGNAIKAEQIFTVVDRKAPTPVLVNIATSTMVNCELEVCAIMFDKGGCNGSCISSFDNCTPKEELYFTFTPVLPKLYIDPAKWENQYNKYGRYFYDPVTGLISTEDKYKHSEALAWDPIRKTSCKYFGIGKDGYGPDHTQILEVYVWDKFAANEDCDNNNYDFGVIVLSINTEGDGCPEHGSIVRGSINNCVFENGLEEVLVNLNNGVETKVSMTDANGKFNTSLEEGNYNITASKQINGIPGLTTLDLVIIQKHVLGLKPVKDYCKLASMDINGDGKITASDILSGRKLILGYTEPKLNYNFLSNTYISENINNPQFSLKDAYNIKLNVEKNVSYNNIDFSGIMTGDVNNSLGFVEGRNDKVVKFMVDELELLSGESYEIPVFASGISECEGVQFELSYDGFEVKNISSDIMDLSKLNYKIDKNGIKFSWSGNNKVSIEENVPLFTLLIEANTQSHLNNALKMAYETIKPEIYRDEEVSDLKLVFRNTVGSFALHQNIPNPFSDKAIIGFDLPVENTYTLSIYDLTGKIIKEINGYGNAGYNSVNVERKDIGGNGVFYYRLKSGDNTDTKKMILIQ